MESFLLGWVLPVPSPPPISKLLFLVYVTRAQILNHAGHGSFTGIIKWELSRNWGQEVSAWSLTGGSFGIQGSGGFLRLRLKDGVGFWGQQVLCWWKIPALPAENTPVWDWTIVCDLGSHDTDALCLPSEHHVGMEVIWLKTSVDRNLVDLYLTLSIRYTLGFLVEPEENTTNEGNQVFHQLDSWSSMQNIIVKNKFQVH